MALSTIYGKYSGASQLLSGGHALFWVNTNSYSHRIILSDLTWTALV